MQLLLTGRPGIGKTTFVTRVLAGLLGHRRSGFTSGEPRDEAGQRQGFEIVTLNGHRGLLAHVSRRGGPRAGRCNHSGTGGAVMARGVLDTGRLLRIAWSIAVVSIIASGSVLPALRAEARATAADPADWLVMLYQDGDDPVLEQDVLTDFNEAERVGSTDQVHIVSQIDRYKGGYKGMGDWSGAKRFEVTKDDDLSQIGSTEVADLGEVDMSRSETLVDFVTWAAGQLPREEVRPHHV